MDQASIRGSIQLPVFFILWSAGVGWLSAQLHAPQPVDGLPAVPPAVQLSELGLDDPLARHRNLHAALIEASEVVSGRWQPGVASETTAASLTSEQIAAAVAVLGSLDIAPSTTRSDELLTLKSNKNNSFVPDKNGAKRDLASAGDDDSRPVPRSRPTASLAVVERADLRPGDDDVVGAVPPGAMRILRHPVGRADTTHRDVKVRARMLLGEATSEASGRAFEALLGELDTLEVEDHEYLGLLAVAALSSGRYLEAGMTYAHLLEREPENARWWAGQALVEDELGRQSAAESAFKNVARLTELRSVLGRYARWRAASGPPTGMTG